MKAISSLILALLLTQFSAHAQTDHFSCGLTEKLKTLYEEYPNLEHEQQEFLARCRETSHGSDRSEALVIPVVFHVIHLNGSENISDQQIYDQMDILNLDFRKQNADTIDIVPEFEDIAADTKIEFRLANKDPQGNCTNGIDRIYSHEAMIGDDYSKLNQWPRSRYLNVWVVASMRPGVAGYAYYPSAVSTGMYYADGIIILNNYIGSIGTSSINNSRALTHEIGHWLGLPHTWGSNNNPGVACGDDEIDDTPETKGHTSCDLNSIVCDSGVVENVQNFMEYAYCSNMFTEGQSGVMNNTLANSVSSRNHLVKHQNHVDTGIDEDFVLCSPLPDFYAADPNVCAGESVQFFASVSRAEVTTYFWNFPGGTPSVSTAMNPTVVYEDDGYHPVTLTASNPAGMESITKEQYVRIMPSYWYHEGAHSESFEDVSLEDVEDWVVVNPENDDRQWEVTDDAYFTGSQSIGIIHYKSDLDPIHDLNYYERLGGLQDILVTPAYNLSNMSTATLSLRFAHATVNSGIYDDSQVQLRVLYKANCDGNWVELGKVEGMDVLTAGYQGTPFRPKGGNEWKYKIWNIPVAARKANTRFKIEFTAGDFANNFYIDDFNISGTVGQFEKSIADFEVYPNPTKGVFNLNLLNSSEGKVLITDVTGTILAEELVSEIDMRMDLSTFANGTYFITFIADGIRSTKRIIKQ